MQLEVPAECLTDVDTILLIGTHEQHTYTIPRALFEHHCTNSEELLDNEEVLYLVALGLADVPEVVKEGLELWKGEDVDVTVDNIRGLLKFAVVLKSKLLFQELMVWLHQAYECKRLIGIVQIHDISRFILQFDSKRTEIKRYCQHQLNSRALFIMEQELDAVPPEDFKVSFIDMLADPGCIWMTLPLIEKAITSKPRAQYILQLFRRNPVLLSVICPNVRFTQDLLTKLRDWLIDSDKPDLVALLELHGTVLSIAARQSSQLSRLVEPLTFDEGLKTLKGKSSLIQLSEEGILNFKRGICKGFIEAAYCDILMYWLRNNLPKVERKPAFIQQLWRTIAFKELTRGYIDDMRGFLLRLCKWDRLDLPMPPDDHNYIGSGFYLTEHDTVALREGYPVFLNKYCEIPGCESNRGSEKGFSIQLNLSDGAGSTINYNSRPHYLHPHYHYHAKAEWCWLAYPSDRDNVMISLLTNDMKQIRYILSVTPQIFVSFMVAKYENVVISEKQTGDRDNGDGDDDWAVVPEPCTRNSNCILNSDFVILQD